VSLHGSYTGLAQELGKKLSELVYQQLEVINLDPKNYPKNKEKLKDKNAILVNDVITTARTCLAYHSQITVDKARVLGWVTLVDRTFGPGPVPVISAIKGEPVRIMES
jgi:pyrimidine operon attenuation protein/uracil phosphoribosyltransferase